MASDIWHFGTCICQKGMHKRLGLMQFQFRRTECHHDVSIVKKHARGTSLTSFEKSWSC